MAIRRKLWLGPKESGSLPGPEEEEEDLILFSTWGNWVLTLKNVLINVAY